MHENIKLAKENMKDRFHIYTTEGEYANDTNVSEGDTIYCVIKMEDGKNVIFWGNISFMKHGEWTFLLTEHDCYLGETVYCMVTIPILTRKDIFQNYSANLFQSISPKYLIR